MKENTPVAYPIFIGNSARPFWHPGRFIAWGTSGEFRHSGFGEIYPSVLLRKPDGRVIERTADGVFILDSISEMKMAPLDAFLWWMHPGAENLYYT